MPGPGILRRLCRRLCHLMLLCQLASPPLAWLAVAVTAAADDDLTTMTTAVTPEDNDSNPEEDSGRTTAGAAAVATAGNDFCPSGRPRDKTRCPSGVQCQDLGLDCVRCRCDYSCRYGERSNATCEVEADVVCDGDRRFEREFTCSYCYLTEYTGGRSHTCSDTKNYHCRSVGPRSNNQNWFVSRCEVDRETLCLGSHKYSRRRSCNWTEGYSWRTALALSVTLGGFGADRFYLGHWQEGIGKLFSFGGLGVWTLVDVVLVAVRYIGPADGSLYI